MLKVVYVEPDTMEGACITMLARLNLMLIDAFGVSYVT
jgi:hypothetical protein